MSILERLIEEDFGIKYNGSSWARSEEHDSLVIDREKQVFYWNSKDVRGDAYIYLTKVRGFSHNDAKEYLRTVGFNGTFIQEIKDGNETIVYPKLVEVFHQNLLEADKTYFYNRTITDKTISRYQLGFHKNFYMIPIFQDGTLKQFQMRRDSPKLIRNYYKTGTPHLFNSDILKIVDEVFITEGLMGALVLQQNGLPSVSMNVGAEGFIPEWIKYFIHINKVSILFDNDSAGEHGAIRIARILGENRCKIYNFWDFDGKGFAVDDYFIDGGTKEDLLNIINKNGRYSFEFNTKNRRNHF